MIQNPQLFLNFTTALAFEYFKYHEVDYAVIETGLGGRLDATNVLQSIASVFTSISLEHTNILGDKNWNNCIWKEWNNKRKTKKYS